MRYIHLRQLTKRFNYVQGFHVETDELENILTKKLIAFFKIFTSQILKKEVRKSNSYFLSQQKHFPYEHHKYMLEPDLSSLRQ